MQKMVQHAFYLAGVWLLALYLGLSPAQALTLSPGAHRLQLPSGQERVFAVRVFNESRQAVRVTPSLADWQEPLGGDKLFRPPGTLPFSLSPYLELNTTPFILPARQSRLVPLKVRVPVDKLGGYHAMAFFHAVPHTPGERGAQVKMAVRLGTTLLYESPDTALIQSRIVERTATYKKGNAPHTELRLKVRNEGNTWLDTSAVVAVMDEGDNLLGTFKLKPRIVLRAQDAVLSGTWHQPLAPGKYRLLITYQYRSKSLTVAHTLWVA